MLLVVVLYAVLASTFVIAKYALETAAPFFLIACRMIVGGTILLGYYRLVRRETVFICPRDWPLFLKTALFHIYLAFIPEFWALRHLTSSKTNILYSSTPFIAAFLSYILLGQKLSFKKVVGMAIGLLGLMPVIVAQSGPEEIGPEFFRISRYEAVLAIAIVSASYAWFLVKRLMDRGYSLLVINGVAMLLGGVGALVTSALAEGLQPIPVYNFAAFVLWVSMLILVANVVVYNLYGWLLKSYSITFVSFAGFLSPLFGALFGWLFRSEHITWHYAVSFVCVAIGLYVFYQDELKSIVI
jgi:drug/metabolite transporter (DMT)-like permease